MFLFFVLMLLIFLNQIFYIEVMIFGLIYLKNYKILLYWICVYYGNRQGSRCFFQRRGCFVIYFFIYKCRFFLRLLSVFVDYGVLIFFLKLGSIFVGFLGFSVQVGYLVCRSVFSIFKLYFLSSRFFVRFFQLKYLELF